MHPSDLVERLEEPHRRTVLSDRQEAAERIRALEKALDEARYWIVKSGAPNPGGILRLIDTALRPPDPT